MSTLSRSKAAECQRWVLSIFTVLCLLLAAGCSHSDTDGHSQAKQLMLRYGCVSCHVHDRVSEAKGLVGPPLNEYHKRSYIAGTLANTPENLTRWLLQPRKINKDSAMPNVGLNKEEAALISDFLLEKMQPHVAHKQQGR